MSLVADVPFRRITPDEFQDLDYEFMRLVFAVHNDLGRLWDEKIYQSELVRRVRLEGIGGARTEVPLEVQYRDFKKTYFMDLLLNDSIVYELKTVRALSGDHHRQVLNYLLMADLGHGKLINFRPASVEHRFVSTKLTSVARSEFRIDDTRWRNFDDDGADFKAIIVELVEAWGMFLDLQLLHEALAYFRGGEEKVRSDIAVHFEASHIGRQSLDVLNDKCGFRISAITSGHANLERHLRKIIERSDLSAIQWVNLNHHCLEFRTLCS